MYTFSIRMNTHAKTTLRLAELRARHQKARVRRTKLGSRVVVKIPKRWKASDVATMLNDRRIVVADWNRDEVKARAGNSEEMMISLATGADVGKFLVYWNGKLTPNKKGEYTITLENITETAPLYIYEGGHRSRWLTQIFKNETLYEGMNLDELREVSNAKDVDDEFTAISNAPIDFAVAVTTRENGIVPIAFLKHEFHQTNFNICPPNAGELIAVSNDTIRQSLVDKLTNALQRTLKEKKREGVLVEKYALVNGALGRIDLMNSKTTSILDKGEITDEQRDNAEKTIAAFSSIETQIKTHFSTKGKAVVTRVKNRGIVLRFDGIIVYALSKCSTDEERAIVVKTVVDFYKMFFENKDTWTSEERDVSKPASGGKTMAGSHIDEHRFKLGWARMKNKVNPIVSAPPIVELPTVTSD